MPGVVSKAVDVMMDESVIQKKKKSLVDSEKKKEKKQRKDVDSDSDDQSSLKEEKKKKKKEKRVEESDDDSSDERAAKAERKAAKELKKRKKAAESSEESEDESEKAKKKAEKKAAKELGKRKSSKSGSSSSSDTEEGGSKKKQARKKEEEDVGSARRASLRSHDGDHAAATLSAAEYRKQHQIAVSGTGVPDPFQTFESTPFSKVLLQSVRQAGFTAPSSIQAQCWPIAISGSDLIAIAKTGSGKTVGYLFPAFSLLSSYPTVSRRGDGPVAVVLAPTRELAIQIQVECDKFCAPLKLRAVCVYGGVPKGPHIRECMMGCHLVIGTPGRFNDFLGMTNPPVIPLNRTKYLVLDEADRMLDMGFEPQIKLIFDAVRDQSKGRPQSIMFTATWPKAVQKMAASYLNEPVQVTIGSSGKELTANEDVTQVIKKVVCSEKDHELVATLNAIADKDAASVIVFANKKYMCDRIVKGLVAHAWAAVSIHGDKDQWERQKALERFTKGQVKVIVATDVAARGLDILGVHRVINYDFPLEFPDYIHRIGRTGRAGATGSSDTLFTAGDKLHAKELVRVMTDAGQHLPPALTSMTSQRIAFSDDDDEDE